MKTPWHLSGETGRLSRLLIAFLFMAPLSGFSRQDSPEIKLGERLFNETRFAQFFAEKAGEAINSTLATGDPVLAMVGRAVTKDSIRSPFADDAISCRACHFVDELKGHSELPGKGVNVYGDFEQRSPIPHRGDGRQVTARNSPPLVGVLDGGDSLLHFDGEFSTARELIIHGFMGRNFGWLPGEEEMARRQFVRVIREDNGTGSAAAAFDGLSYVILLRGEDPRIPDALRLPPQFRFDAIQASDDAVVEGCVRLVEVYLSSLRFSRDEKGDHNGSPYDAFIALNKLPASSAAGEAPRDYVARLRTALETLHQPRFVDDPGRQLRYHDQPFRFGAAELRGLKLFLSEGRDKSGTTGAGNCAACHLPPHFSDFSFHNTGRTQEEYDQEFGEGAFIALFIPDRETRNREYDAGFPTQAHPKARAPFGKTPDLGLWNVFANPDIPGPQERIRQLLEDKGNPVSDDVLLTRAIARFKTPTLRSLGQSAPYMHSGGVKSIEDVVMFYQRASTMARADKLRNPAPELRNIQLKTADQADLVAFLRALNEDYD